MMKIPIIIKDFKDGKNLFIEVNINGQNAIFLVDTGVSKSIIDSRKLYKFTSKTPVKSFVISGINKDANAASIKIDKFTLGKITIKGKEFNIIDLINLNNAFSSNHMIVVDGILGNDILIKLNSIIDFNKMILKIENEVLSEEKK